MSVRSVLASEGLLKKASHDELEAQFEVALQDLIREAGLPPVRISGFKNQEVKVPVPRGFESMWSELWIELSIQRSAKGLFGSLDWRYKHPGGGSNGVTIGRISAMAENFESGWRLETGKYQVFPATRFPSDPF